MAIKTMPFYSIVLRVFVQQKIDDSGWRALVQQAALGVFDGEIVAFGAMNPMDHENQCDFLKRVGFKGPEHGDDADFAEFQSGMGRMPNWLECVRVRYLNGQPGEVDAWKLRYSDVYTLHDFHERRGFPTKGYEVDWPPFIGAIND